MNTLKNILREDHDEALRHDIRLSGVCSTLLYKRLLASRRAAPCRR